MSEQFLELTWKLIFSKVTFLITFIAGAKVESPRKKDGKIKYRSFCGEISSIIFELFPLLQISPSFNPSINPT